MRRSVILIANAEQWVPMSGSVMQLADLGVASTVQVQVGWAGPQDLEDLGSASRLFKIGPTNRRFAGFSLTSTVNCTVSVLVADDDVGFAPTTSVALDTSQFPLPVETRNSADLAATATYPGTVAMTTADAAIMAANTNARRVVIRNAPTSADSVAIYRGAAAVTFANAGIVIAPGETYIEDRFAGVNQGWRGRCNTGTATLSVEVYA